MQYIHVHSIQVPPGTQLETNPKRMQASQDTRSSPSSGLDGSLKAECNVKLALEPGQQVQRVQRDPQKKYIKRIFWDLYHKKIIITFFIITFHNNIIESHHIMSPHSCSSNFFTKIINIKTLFNHIHLWE